MATAIITKEELSSAIMSLQTKQEVADLLAITIDELDQEIQNNFNMTFEQKQKQMKVKIKYSKNNEIIMSKKTDKNTTKLLEDNVMTAVGTMPQIDTKPISLEHIKVVNNYVDGMTKIAAYKKVYETPDSKMSDDTATKGVARVLARPEVKEYLAERIGEIEAMTKISKSKVVQTLVEIMTGSKYREKIMIDEKVQISAAAQISKMMGYDAPIKTETKTFTLEQLAEKLLIDD